MSDVIFNPNQPRPTPGDQPVSLDLGLGGPQPATTKAPIADLIIDSDSAGFVAHVIDASQTLPVLVNFWSPRAKASLAFDALLETLVKRAGGLIKLVRINVDENQALAQQLRVQSVPTVFAFKDGRPADGFTGEQSEPQVQSFIDKLIGDAKPPVEIAMDQAAALLHDDQAQQAEDLYTSILAQDPTYTPALAGTIRAIAALGEFDRAHDMLNSLDARIRASTDIAQALSALELAQQSATIDASGMAEHEAQVAANPKDLEARLHLAQALYAQGRSEDAIDHLLEIVRLDRTWNDAAGRKQMLKIFDTLGSSHPLTVEARKRLSAVLFS